MKILFLHRDLPPVTYAGVAIQVHRLANALCILGHQVLVYSHSAQPADALYRVLHINIPGLNLAIRFAPFLKRLWYPLWYRSLNMQGYDAVHIHGDGGFLQYRGNFVRTFYGTAALEYRHARSLKGKLAQGLSFWMEQREAHRCRLKVGISPHIAGHLQGVDTVIPCMLAATPDAADFEKTAYPSLVYLGSRKSRKRGDMALDLFLKLKILHPKLRMSYVGPLHEIEELKDNPEYDSVDFHSRISQAELTTLYQKSWLYLCLASYEGFGVGIIEAMAHSCLVITSPHPGSEYLIKDGDTGIVVRPETAEKQISSIINDHASRKEMVKRAKEFSFRFSPSKVASAYVKLYQTAHARIGNAN